MKRVFAFIGFSCAITLFVLNYIGYNAYIYFLITTVILFIVSLLIKSIRQARVLPTVLGSAVFACLIFTITMTGSVMPQRALENSTAYGSCHLTEPYEITAGGNYEYTVVTDYIDKQGAPQKIKLKLYSSRKIDAEPYDSISGEFIFLQGYDKPASSHGGYGKGIYLCAMINNPEVSRSDSKPVGYYIITLRERIKNVFVNSFGRDEAALASSIILGDKSLIRQKILNDFIVSGTSHIMAVSGLHIGILYSAVYFLFYPIKNKRYLSGFVYLASIFFYIALTGFSKSALRAGVMIAVLIISKMINKQADTLNSLGVAAFVLCLNPFAPTDAGAVLTVLALIGISVIYPLAFRLNIKNRIINYFVSAVLTALSVIIATLPALWLYFGSISVLSIFLNVVFIPLTELALVSLLAFLVLSPISPVLAFVPHTLSSFSLKGLLNLADFSASGFSFLYINVDTVIFGVAISAALIFLGTVIILQKRPNVKAVLAICLSIIIAGGALSVYQSKNEVFLTVTQDGCVFIVDGDNITAIGLNSSKDEYYFDTLSRSHDNCIDAELFPYNRLGNVELYRDGEKTFVSIYNNVFEISSDCVTINNVKLYRDINSRFNQQYDYVVHIREKRELYLRRVDNG